MHAGFVNSLSFVFFAKKTRERLTGREREREREGGGGGRRTDRQTETDRQAETETERDWEQHTQRQTETNAAVVAVVLQPLLVLPSREMCPRSPQLSFKVCLKK